ncbi:MAG: cysteine--tRNA ligase [Candidatus Delongbacteria bacterium]|nr:cysteine--tRNA ligase [Candidatus Delongbacteria bacterium]MCG2760815.1 cysteine--tRNA ligase [Candidatus Delongbacteria bacterium]
MLQIYNSLTKKKEVFKSVEEGKVSIYTCGPTVYSSSHVGNFSAFLMADLLVRYLKYKGFEVKWIMNITDVGHLTDDNELSDSGEDKMEAASKKENKTVWEIARHYEDLFMKDLKTLKILPAFKYPRATEHIEEMIDMIKLLDEKGVIYETSDGVYFDISKFKDYGKLSGNSLEALQAGARVEVNEDKKSPFDFALWKKLTGKNEDHIMKWDSPWGTGFPGWHLECSAMSKKYLGETLDFHTGGEDNKFPHHESEIAQSETANGKKFVNYWMHKSHIVLNDEKMSKSLGNFFTVQDVMNKGFSADSIRFTFITAHYRSKLNFNEDQLNESQKTIDKFNDFIQTVLKVNTSDCEDETASIIKSAKQQFEKGMDDDLNMSVALASLFGFMKSIRKNIESGNVSKESKTAVLDFMKELNSIFEVFDFDEKKEKEFSKDEQDVINKLIEKRNKFRAEKNWAEADKIREELIRMGVNIADKK